MLLVTDCGVGGCCFVCMLHQSNNKTRYYYNERHVHVFTSYLYRLVVLVCLSQKAPQTPSHVKRGESPGSVCGEHPVGIAVHVEQH